MRGRRWLVAIGVALSVALVACGGDDGDSSESDSGDTPPIVLTATALSESPNATPEPTPRPSPRATPSDRTAGADFTLDEAVPFLEYVLLQPADIADPDWVIQSDDVTDNAAAAEAQPDLAESIERCGRLLSRIITNFPPDSVAAYLAGKPVAFFSQGTLYETPAGAKSCADEAAVRLAAPGAIAELFGSVFNDPAAVVVTPFAYDAVGEGSSAFTLTGKTDAAGTTIDLTLLVVSFRDGAATFAVGMAVPANPAVEDLRPYVDLVFERSQAFQQ